MLTNFEMQNALGLKILIIGGYGNFGRRLVALLEAEPRLTLLIAGRSAQTAADFCASRADAKARLVPLRFDRRRDVTAQLAAAGPDMVVDASGPFQAYGAKPYGVVEACLAAGAHYLDLADDADFAAGIGVLNEAAQAAGLFCISGVSTSPALTGAVARHLGADMAAVTAISAGIAPSPFAGMGANVIRAIASYAGQRKMAADGSVYFPLTQTRIVTIAPPGQKPLRPKLFAQVEAPDMKVLPRLFPGAKIWIGAGTEPRLFLRALIFCAWLVRRKILPSLSPLAKLMHVCSRYLRWGEHRGRMFVEVEGRDAGGAAVTKTWHLIAEGDAGPFIPVMAPALIIQNFLAGDPPEPGARDAAGALSLAAFEPLLARYGIKTGTG